MAVTALAGAGEKEAEDADEHAHEVYVPAPPQAAPRSPGGPRDLLGEGSRFLRHHPAEAWAAHDAVKRRAAHPSRS